MTTVLWIIAAIVIVNILLVTFWYFFRDKEEKPSVEPVEKPSEPVSNQEPTTEPDEPEKPVEPKFKAGDWVDDGIGCAYLIKEIYGYCYFMEHANGCTSIESIDTIDKFCRLWTIADAKIGDVLCTEGFVFIFKEVRKDKGVGYFCANENELHEGDESTFHVAAPNSLMGSINNGFTHYTPATTEQRDILFKAMAGAGYTWDSDTKTLSKIEEPEICMYTKDNYTDEDRKTLCEGCEEKCEYKPKDEEPKEEETDLVEMVRRKIEDVIDYFAQVVPIDEKTRKYLLSLSCPDINFCDKSLFHVVYNYYGNMENDYVYEQFYAWVFGLVLSELVPDKRQEIMQMAYDYKVKGKDQPTYGYTFETDPNIARLVASSVYASTRDADIIPELRKEVGGKMVTYKNDVSELYIDCTKFMPTAPFPFLEGYTYRPKGLPVDATPTADMDEEIHDYISQYYSLDTKDKEKRQRTIQAIADKEYKKPHLFGKPRTVKDDKYGEMTFNPVFGKHNIGIEIPDDGIIADMCYKLGKPCSHTRETLLNQEYGRRRPGEGETDGKANTDPKQRVLVNYPIEEGDGRTTGYYNKNGVYVDNNGVSIGDYETYFQNQVYANSYPSGHSAYIMGVGLILMMIMPERADKILRAVNEYTNSRMICRFHWQSDTIHGRVIGTMMVPVLAATTNVDFDNLLKKAKEEYQRILSGNVTPEPTPEPTEKVNTSLAYFIGGYGSCHVDAGETAMVHRCTKQCTKERHPAIQVNQRVEFTIEGAGVTTDDGKTSGVWEANTPYGIKCPAVTEDKYAYITMRNENGVKVLEYRCSKDGTHDDGCNNY